MSDVSRDPTKAWIPKWKGLRLAPDECPNWEVAPDQVLELRTPAMGSVSSGDLVTNLVTIFCNVEPHLRITPMPLLDVITEIARARAARDEKARSQ